MKVAARADGAPSSRSGQDVPDPSESFDQSMQELEALIEQMENGRLPLERAAEGYAAMDERRAIKVLLEI